MHFVGNFILNMCEKLFDNNVIIVTSSANRTQSICVLFSPPVTYPDSQVIHSTEKNLKE